MFSKIQLRNCLSHPNNPVVFLDIEIGTIEIGRMTFELFAHKVPRTAENFRQFCLGLHRLGGTRVGYKDANFHRVFKHSMIQGGDFLFGNGTGSVSIYGPSFRDEGFHYKHDCSGLLSMASLGKDRNGSQFYITCGKCNFLDNKNVVFGRMIHGMDTLLRIQNTPVTAIGLPKTPVVIINCGQVLH